MPEHITLRGFVGKDPESHLFDDGTVAARFRLATTTRRFDADKNTWVDINTNWYSVRCFRGLAMHVMNSVRCGQPVIVTGKLQIQEWMSDNGPRTTVQVDATAIGHDLNFGTANFSRTGGQSQRPQNAQGGSEEPAEPAESGNETGGLQEHERLDEHGHGEIIASDPDDTFTPLSHLTRGMDVNENADEDSESGDRTPVGVGSD